MWQLMFRETGLEILITKGESIEARHASNAKELVTSFLKKKKHSFLDVSREAVQITR